LSAHSGETAEPPLPNSPSSPEEFYGFKTPTKELDRPCQLIAIKKKLSQSFL
jgi:hypothetical protein